MSNISISDLEVGMKVKFYDKWDDVPDASSWANLDSMEKWLGGVRTIRRFEPAIGDFRIEEDIEEYDAGWYWHPSVVEKIIEDELNESEFGFDSLFEVM